MNGDSNNAPTLNVIPMPAASLPAAEEPSPPSPEEIERLTAMHTEAAGLNRVTIHTNFQQAIQDAILDPKQRKDLSKLAASFHQWAEGEALLNRN